MKDQDIVKQNLDASCGAASIATLLNGYYLTEYTEMGILALLGEKDKRSNFWNMTQAINALGFNANGYETTMEGLQKLRIPVIVHMSIDGKEHFSVLKGIGQSNGRHYFLLGNPSQGQILLTEQDFQRYWLLDQRQQKGKILLITPNKMPQPTADHFFVRFSQPISENSWAYNAMIQRTPKVFVNH